MIFNSFYNKEELLRLGFALVGKNVLLSKKTSIYSPDKIVIGNNVRIDDYCILSGKINIGNFVHIAAYTALYGAEAGIYIGDFANISSRIVIYAINDDYSGETLTNPMIPEKYKNVESKCVNIKKHVIIGTGSTVLPGVTLEEGSCFGAMSLIYDSSEPWSMYVGIPVRKIKPRSRNLLKLEESFMEENNGC